MADTIDRAQTEQEAQLADALARQGIRSRVTEIPDPHYGDPTSPAPACPNNCHDCACKGDR